ncbi:hypothetical protein [Streptomyces sp. NPDC018045]|uniref:hypothetical protein n=1 Tax=Streptomyces sp. NPDC018045 TaxID=3365037 RepID=UPI0037A914A5
MTRRAGGAPVAGAEAHIVVLEVLRRTNAEQAALVAVAAARTPTVAPAPTRV